MLESEKPHEKIVLLDYLMCWDFFREEIITNLIQNDLYDMNEDFKRIVDGFIREMVNIR
jgi:hypothetical protein